MLDKLLESEMIREFLSSYPQSEWPSVLTQAVQYAIISYNALKYTGFHHTSNLKSKKPKSVKPKKKSWLKSKEPLRNSSVNKRKISECLNKTRAKEDKLIEQNMAFLVPSTDRGRDPGQFEPILGTNLTSKQKGSSVASIKPNKNMKKFYQNEFKHR